MSRENWVLAFAYGAALATKENQEYKFFIQDNLNFSMLNNVNCGTFTSFTNSTQVSSDKFPQIQISFILGNYCWKTWRLYRESKGKTRNASMQGGP